MDTYSISLSDQPPFVDPSIIGRFKRSAVHHAGTLLRDLTHGYVPTPAGIVVVPEDMDPRSCLSLMSGRYEHDEIEIVERYFFRDKRIVEIGGYIGAVARYAFGNKLMDGGTYICVEPNPNSQAALAKNLARVAAYHPSRSYEIISAAMCEPGRDGQDVQFFQRSDLCSGLRGQVMERATETIINVPALSLSRLMQRYAPDGASLICDAEGFEIIMLEQYRQVLSMFKQIAMELHDPSLTGHRETQGDMIDKFYELGFNLRAQIGSCYYLTPGP